MCLAMYLFTDAQLPHSKWDKDHPALWIQPARSRDDERAGEWPHAQKFIYYIGGYQGCGCGWAAVVEFDAPEDASMKARGRQSLVEILRRIDRHNS